MKRSLLFLLLFAFPAWGQGLSLSGDGVRVVKVDKVVVVKEDATVVQLFPVTVNAPKGAGLYFWNYPATVTAQDQGDSLSITAGSKGATTVSCKAITPDVDKDGKFKGFLTTFYSVTFTIGDVPAPPGPGPGPNPDPPSPAPIPVAGYRVLFLYESNDKLKYTKDQYNAMFSNPNRAWLDQNATAEKPGYWIVEPTQDMSSLPKHWGAAQAAAKAQPGFTLPWIVISNGTSGFSGPLPKTAAEIDALEKKYLK